MLQPILHSCFIITPPTLLCKGRQEVGPFILGRGVGAMSGCDKVVPKRDAISFFLQRLLQRGIMVLALSITFVTNYALKIPTSAEERSTERARYSSDEESTRLRFTPLRLAGGSKLTLISPIQWSDVADELLTTLSKSHANYANLLGPIPAFTTAIRLMDEKSFYALTGAPSWTNAMFFRGQIIVPLNTEQPVDLDNIHRSVRHEYTHAVVSALSAGRAPGWLDEGIAQWAEGTPNPALKPALKSWLRSNDPVPLRLLQGGFTKLNTAMVPAAYAQSLVAADAVMQGFGFKKITTYLRGLRNGLDKEEAFHLAFGVTDQQFEARLGMTLRQWAAGDHRHQ